MFTVSGSWFRVGCVSAGRHLSTCLQKAVGLGFLLGSGLFGNWGLGSAFNDSKGIIPSRKPHNLGACALGFEPVQWPKQKLKLEGALRYLFGLTGFWLWGFFLGNGSSGVLVQGF